MSRISKTAVFMLVVTAALTALNGCKKSTPAPEDQQTTTGRSSPAAAQKIVGPRIAEPTEADKAEMKTALKNSDFRQGIRLQAADEIIDIKVGHLVPQVVDWNNDGKKDMLVGQFSGGTINLYLNIGTDEAPVFGEGEILHADDKPIRLDAG
jgi:hypothetical protein